MTENTRIIDLTVGELKSIIQLTVLGQIDEILAQKRVVNDHENIVYGISGLANLLGCSKTHAQKLKSSGIFDGGITQVGRTITVYPNRVLEIWDSLKQNI